MASSATDGMYRHRGGPPGHTNRQVFEGLRHPHRVRADGVHHEGHAIGRDFGREAHDRREGGVNHQPVHLNWHIGTGSAAGDD